MDNKMIGNRIEQRRKNLGLTLEFVAGEVGVAKSTVQRYEKGTIEKIKLPVIEAIARVLNVNPAWICCKSDDMTPVAKHDFDIRLSGLLPLPANKAYPLVGDIACGTPILAEENITEYIQFPDDLNAQFCLRCHGDSMIDARIFDGDIVFIREQPEVSNGEIAAVLIGEEATLKRVYRTGDTLTLMAANPAYPPMVYTGEQLESVRILGKAVYFLSAVK